MEEQGIRFAKYLVVPRTLIFIFNGKNVLLLKGAPEKRIWAGYYNGIGGHVEPGEDVLTSAKRELLEETGIQAIPIILCGIITVDTGTSTGVVLYVFKGETSGLDTIPSEEGKPEWIPVDNLNQIRMVMDLYHLLPRVVSWRPEDQIIYGKYSYSESGELLTEFMDES